MRAEIVHAYTQVGKEGKEIEGAGRGGEGDQWETGWRNKFVRSINKCQSYLISKKRIFLGTAIIRSWNDACNLVKFYRSPIFSRAYRRDVRAVRYVHRVFIIDARFLSTAVFELKNKVSNGEGALLWKEKSFSSARWNPLKAGWKRFEFAIDRFLGNETSVEVRRIRGGTRNGGKNVYEKGGQVGFMLANDFLSIDLPGSYGKCS